MALKRAMFTAEPEGAERRRSVRHVTVLQVAKLLSSFGEELCLLRDVSETGLKAEVYSPVQEGEPVTVELRTGHRVAGKVVWVERPMIGVHFVERVPILSMLAHCAFDDRLTRIRPPRIDIELPATLRTWDEVLQVTVNNISQAGAGLIVGKSLGTDVTCDITLPSLSTREAKIRWSHKGECGLQLMQPLSYREFAAWRGLLYAARAAGVEPTAPRPA